MMAIFTESKNRRWLRQEEKKRNVVFFLKLLKVERKGGRTEQKYTRRVKTFCYYKRSRLGDML